MKFIKRLFGKSDDSGDVLCPQCERAMEPGHKCAGMSRRFFFGAMAGAAVAAVVLPHVAIEAPAAIVSVPAPIVVSAPDMNALLAGIVDRKKWCWYDTIKLSSSGVPGPYTRFGEHGGIGARL